MVFARHKRRGKEWGATSFPAGREKQAQQEYARKAVKLSSHQAGSSVARCESGSLGVTRARTARTRDRGARWQHKQE
eukprot:gene20058-biopygen8522